jgi:SAM-dependent methyltransferase
MSERTAFVDRATWLRERRVAVEADYDAEAADYDADEYETTSHPRFVDALLASCPAAGRVLDVPCGTGRYFAQVRASGRHVVGVDQSAGMLAQARARGLADDLIQTGLQELPFDAEFDGVMTIDAMENVPPEDWPLVLANLRHAVRRGGSIYLTVEEHDDADLEAAYVAARARGLPVVRGELVGHDFAGYHYVPDRARVAAWLEEAGLTVVDEATDREEHWAYWHLLLRAPV